MIDAFSHVTPQNYLDVLSRRAPNYPWVSMQRAAFPALNNLALRFKVMDKYPGLVQVLSLSQPALEDLPNQQDAVELATIANDEMAELVAKYPDRFAGAVACLPMNNVEAALSELDRAITKLKFKGAQIYSDINGKTLDSPEFFPLYDEMVKYDLPVLLHPQMESKILLHANEDQLKYKAAITCAPPFKSTLAMVYMVEGSVFERYPSLKIITHHGGGMVPFFAARIAMMEGEKISNQIMDKFRNFYADTALQGNSAALMCAYSFFGADHILFGTDMPYDDQLGDRSIRGAMIPIDQLNISAEEKKKIFEDNARRLFKLPT